MKTLLLLRAALCVTLPAMAEHLTPERVFADPSVNGPAARNVQLSPDGELVTYLKGKADDQNALDLWAAGRQGRRAVPACRFPRARAKETVLSEAEKSRRERMRITQHGVVEYHWDEQGKFILVPLDGDLYLASAPAGRCAVSPRPQRTRSIPKCRRRAATCPSCATRISM